MRCDGNPFQRLSADIQRICGAGWEQRTTTPPRKAYKYGQFAIASNPARWLKFAAHVARRECEERVRGIEPQADFRPKNSGVVLGGHSGLPNWIISVKS